MRIESGLGTDTLLLRSFRGTESVSAPYTIEAEVLATRAVTSDELLAKPVHLVIDDGGGERLLHGLVRNLTAAGRDEEFYLYRLQIVPWFWFLSLNEDCRVFQNMDVRQIVEQVFDDRGYSDYTFDCQRSFPTREFTVQYQESDFDFVSRLLEEEGIFYFFKHEESRHVMVLADHQGALQLSPTQPDVRLSDVGEGIEGERVIHEITVDTAVHPGKTTLADYDYLKPSAELAATVEGSGWGSLYDYPAGFRESGVGTRLAEIRLEAEEALATVLRGQGDCFGLIPGFRFRLSDSEVDGEYLVTTVHHDAGVQGYRGGDADQVQDPYLNSFAAIPFATPFRPRRRTPRPRLGVQTAVVVGPSGEEIFTDEYGRVKVHFHWDREGRKDEKSSCWIRVASTWAGNKWGAIQIPRIGQEVVVDFLDGNPDRPLITGSVYNAQQMPPWEATPTQSGWKSHSTKQGAAESNELRFEDKKGEEEIYVRAEKDLTFEVVNDETVTVGHDRKVTVENDEKLEVKNDRTRKVAKDEEVTIEGEETRKVTKDQSITIVQGNRSVQVKQGNLETKADMGKVVYEAMQSIELKVGKNSIKIDQTGITLDALMVKIEGKTMAELKAAMVKVEGKAMVQVQASGMLMAKGSVTMIG
jgi:type VI secretion system secreted protein VgrG